MQEHPEQLMIVEGNHERRGYEHGELTTAHIAYHYFIGSDGTLVKNRSNDERTMHTRCGMDDDHPDFDPDCKGEQRINEESIAIVLAGNLDIEYATQPQMETLTALLNDLTTHFKIPRGNVMGHRHASSTTCPGKNLLDFISWYSGNHFRDGDKSIPVINPRGVRHR
jgi:N-acetyl-anhydromuramyl-L-alanine amidase AmpD